MRMDLAVAAIIKAENLEASEEEVEKEYADLAGQYGMEVDMVKKYLPEAQIKDQIVSKKAVAVVVDNATAIKPEKKTTKKAAKKDEAEAETVEAENDAE